MCLISPLLAAGMTRGNMPARLHYPGLLDPALAESWGCLAGNTNVFGKGREGRWINWWYVLIREQETKKTQREDLFKKLNLILANVFRKTKLTGHICCEVWVTAWCIVFFYITSNEIVWLCQTTWVFPSSI